ncbi:MAG TPA: hypothetical protein VKM69_12170 [Natronoarchaeum rubrum]|nr:hypothetical protein [Natronoarchaeum rubrum]
MIHTIQLAGANTIGGLVLALVVPTVMIAFGSYVGVLMALQSFFDAQSWQEATADSEQ